MPLTNDTPPAIIEGSLAVGDSPTWTSGTWSPTPDSLIQNLYADDVLIGGGPYTSGGFELVAGQAGADIKVGEVAVLDAIYGNSSNVATESTNEDLGALSSFAATQTSGDGLSPYTFSGTFGADIAPGDHLMIQRSTASAKDANGDYVTITQEVDHYLTLSELEAGFISSDALELDGWTQPTGVFYEQYWWARDNGQVSPRTEITDEILAFTATLDASRKHAQVNLSNGNRTYAENYLGGYAQPPAMGNQVLTNHTGYVEMTITARSTGGGSEPSYASVYLAAASETFGFSSYRGANYNQMVDIALPASGSGIIYNEGSVLGTSVPATAVGDTIGMLVHLASRRVWFRKSGGTWLTGTPVFQSDGSLDGSSTGGTVLDAGTDIRFVIAGTGYGTTLDINAGQDAFVLGALPTYAIEGWA